MRIPADFCFVVAFASATATAQTPPNPNRVPVADSAHALRDYDLPDDWEAAYWGSSASKALAALDPKSIAALVPNQAGFRFVSCPACDAPESDDPLSIWNPEEPEKITCRACGGTFPNDEFPAKAGDPPKVPEESVEVLPGVIHKYPYHELSETDQSYPGERIYLAARRDDQARADLAKFALYAAVRSREQAGTEAGRHLATLASALLIRFAQVYPAYATHLDRPGTPKVLQQADLAPPYRRGYRTAKWGWTGSSNVPAALAIAHAILRDGPEMAATARDLEVQNPGRLIDRELFQAAARFVADQPEEVGEEALVAARGLLLAAQLLGDRSLAIEAKSRLERFASSGFYHDGTWHEADPAAQARVVAMLDDDLGRLAATGSLPSSPPLETENLAVLELARSLQGGPRTGSEPDQVMRASWADTSGRVDGRESTQGPRLQGGAGIVRLEVGEGTESLGLELQGLGEFGDGHPRRLTLAVEVGAVPVLDDLDGLEPTPTGFDRASVSHNTVVVDGLNQRESFQQSLIPAPGADILFHAVDPDFQVATFDDRLAYPTTTSRYRQTVAVLRGAGGSPYAVSIFEVQGGRRHDQFYQAAPTLNASWRTSAPLTETNGGLLPSTIPFVRSADPDTGRWFVQSLGEFEDLRAATLERFAQAVLTDGQGLGVRLHVLGDLPAEAIVANTPGPGGSSRRSSLILRREVRDESEPPLKSTFVTVIEPMFAHGPSLGRVGRVDAEDGVVILAIESGGVAEHLVFNPTPGTAIRARLADGRTLSTDGLLARVVADRPTVAGGTFAEIGGVLVSQPRAWGLVLSADGKGPIGPGARGWFGVDRPLPDVDSLAGRSLTIRHGNGISRAWTVVRAVNLPNGGARVEVRELSGFRIDPETRDAVYEQFPGFRAPGPHTLRIDRIAR